MNEGVGDAFKKLMYDTVMQVQTAITRIFLLMKLFSLLSRKV